MLHRLIERWKSWRLGRNLKAGRVLRGRQVAGKDSGGAVKARAEPKATLHIRGQRAGSDTWEEVL